jgi:hypothetical protein
MLDSTGEASKTHRGVTACSTAILSPPDGHPQKPAKTANHPWRLGSKNNVGLPLRRRSRGISQLIASIGLAETVLHGPSLLASVPGSKSPRPIISASYGLTVPAIVEIGRGPVARAIAWRRRGNLQFDTERSFGVACAPIDQRCLDFLSGNSARIAFNIVQNIVALWRTI